ncbi:hypothetical protein AAH991_27205 [Microbispora sp. ZYX-F-249]|uniref:DNA-binding protein n=1 Tax=Microbispora maris TaxID=3144104 RepID=A0ABV0AVD7_9ACTN
MSTSNFWSPDRIAARQTRQAAQVAAHQAAQQQAQQADFMSTVGRTLVDIVNRYVEVERRPADTKQVERDFLRTFPNASSADFRQSVETLKQEGVLYEHRGSEGLMGIRETRLYVL